MTVTAMAAVFMASMASGASPFGITRFAIHYLFPFCLFAALALSGLVACRVDCERFAPRLGFASEATNLLPYARLAGELTRRGLSTAQFVTLSPRDAGNLAIYLPNARALSLSARIEPPPPDPIANRPCVLLWGGESSVPPEPPPPANPSPSKLLKQLSLAASVEDAEDVPVDWPKPLIGPQRRSVWHLLRGESVEAACRRVAVKGML